MCRREAGFLSRAEGVTEGCGGMVGPGEGFMEHKMVGAASDPSTAELGLEETPGPLLMTDVPPCEALQSLESGWCG